MHSSTPRLESLGCSSASASPSPYRQRSTRGDAWKLPSGDAPVDQIRWDPGQHRWSEPVGLPLERGIFDDED